MRRIYAFAPSSTLCVERLHEGSCPPADQRQRALRSHARSLAACATLLSRRARSVEHKLHQANWCGATAYRPAQRPILEEWSAQYCYKAAAKSASNPQSAAMRPKFPASFILGAVTIPHHISPDAPRGPELRDLLKEIVMRVKEKLSRGAKLSTGSPRSSAQSTYSIPSRSVNASSCTAVDPASRM